MSIQVRLFLSARKYASQWQDQDGRIRWTLPSGSALGDLLSALAIPTEAGLAILVNGQNLKETTPLRDGDEVTIFPALAGG